MNRKDFGYFDHIINKGLFGNYIYWKIAKEIYLGMDETDKNETIIVFTDENVDKFKENLRRYLDTFALCDGDKIKLNKENKNSLEYKFKVDNIFKNFRIMIFDIFALMDCSDGFRGFRSELIILDIKTITYEQMEIELLTHRLIPMNVYSTLQDKPYYGMMLLYRKDNK